MLEEVIPVCLIQDKLTKFEPGICIKSGIVYLNLAQFFSLPVRCSFIAFFLQSYSKTKQSYQILPKEFFDTRTHGFGSGSRHRVQNTCGV